VNDNAPVFSTPTSISVSEDAAVGSPVGRVSAQDADQGQNAVIVYSLLPSANNTFAIGPTTGVLTLTYPLDREDHATYTLVVIATNPGSLPMTSSSVAITIIVVDVNDHTPVLTLTGYATSVSEDQPAGSTVLSLTATDLDVGLNAELRYVVTSGDDVSTFALDSYTGDLSIRWTLDYETESIYNLNVTVHDLGSPKRSSFVSVVVTVLDSHDTAPVFRASPYVVYATERPAVAQSTPPTYITRLTATTGGSPQFSMLSYFFAADGRGSSSPFSLNSSTGVVTAVGVLDSDKMFFYLLTVIAVDSGLFCIM